MLSGTVTRLDFAMQGDGEDRGRSIRMVNATQIASGYIHRTDPAALVVGPTGLAYDPRNDVLFVAATGNNTIFAIDHARSVTQDHGMGRVVYQDHVHLHGPLGLALAPNGHLITANGDAVNPSPAGTQN